MEDIPMRRASGLLRIRFLAALGVSCPAGQTSAAEAVTGKQYYVFADGNDANDSPVSCPLWAIFAAAQLAQADNVVTVRESVYRERINPPRCGTFDRSRITYQAEPGEEALIKDSEVIKQCQKVKHDTFCHCLIRGDRFNPKGRDRRHQHSRIVRRG
jgi:hypothetical protein